MRRFLVPLVAGVLLLVPSTGAATAPLDALRDSCHGARSSDPRPVAYRICEAKVPSFDGTELDATLTMPARRPRKRRPLVVFLHGFLGDKGEYRSLTRKVTGPDRGTNAYKTVHWNNVWFASRGYVVLNYTARGQGDSDGQMGLARKDIEGRDTQYLTGLLADDPVVRIHPRRIGVIGSSYGGGQAWLLLTTKGRGARRYGS